MLFKSHLYCVTFFCNYPLNKNIFICVANFLQHGRAFKYYNIIRAGLPEII